MLIYTVCQVICGLSTLVAVVAWFSLGGWINIGVMGVGLVLTSFAYEFYCVYIWIKAR